MAGTPAAQLGWIHVGLGPATDGARSGSRGRTATVGPWLDARRGPVRRRSNATRRRSSPWPPPSRERTTMTTERRRPASPRSTCPTSGCPTRARSCPPSLYAARLDRAARARWRRAATTGSSCTPTASTARTSSWLTGFDPRFEEAVLIVGPAGDPAILVGNECYGMAGAAPLPMRRDLFQDLSLPGQPRDRSRPLAEILGDEGIGPGSRVGVVGWKTYARPRARSTSRPSSSTSCARLTGRGRHWSRTRPTCSSTRPTACGSSTRSTSWPRSSTRPARPRTASAGCCSASGRG